MLTCSSPCATQARTSSNAFASPAAAGGITNSFFAEPLFFSGIASSNLAQHIVTLDTQRIHSSRAQGIAELCSGLRIEAPAMPSAYHPAILDRAIGKRRATMRTLIV